jgi:hypothetical protein
MLYNHGGYSMVIRGRGTKQNLSRSRPRFFPAEPRRPPPRSPYSVHLRLRRGQIRALLRALSPLLSCSSGDDDHGDAGGRRAAAALTCMCRSRGPARACYPDLAGCRDHCLDLKLRRAALPLLCPGAPWPRRPLACCDILQLATCVPPSSWRQPPPALPPTARVRAGVLAATTLAGRRSDPAIQGKMACVGACHHRRPATVAALTLPPAASAATPTVALCSSLQHPPASLPVPVAPQPPGVCCLTPSNWVAVRAPMRMSTKSLHRGLHWPSPLAQLLSLQTDSCVTLSW